MKVSVFGLGYVGAVTSAFLASNDHDVIGVDINQQTIDLVNSGRSPVVESDLDEMMKDAVKRGKLKATFDSRSAVFQSELSIIAVSAPVNPSGESDTTVLRRVCAKLGQILAQKETFHIFVVRGTVPPGTTEDIVIPIIEEESGKKVFLDFDVCVNPHFLRAGSIVRDCKYPPTILIGQQDDRAGNKVVELFGGGSATVVRTSIHSAELIWYLSDLYRAFKHCFSMESAALCKSAGTDIVELTELIAAFEKSGIDDPGAGAFAFRTDQAATGLAAIRRRAVATSDAKLPLLDSIGAAQSEHIRRVVSLIGGTGSRKIGLAGISVSPGSAELRGSMMLEVASELRSRGLEVRAYDQAVLSSSSKLPIKLDSGPGQDIIESLAGSMDELYNWADVIVIGHKDPEFEYLASLDAGKIVIDLVRLTRDISDCPDTYKGIYW